LHSRGIFPKHLGFKGFALNYLFAAKPQGKDNATLFQPGSKQRSRTSLFTFSSTAPPLPGKGGCLSQLGKGTACFPQDTVPAALAYVSAEEEPRMSPGDAEQPSCGDRKDARIPFPHHTPPTANRLTEINKDSHKLSYQLRRGRDRTQLHSFYIMFCNQSVIWMIATTHCGSLLSAEHILFANGMLLHFAWLGTFPFLPCSFH